MRVYIWHLSLSAVGDRFHSARFPLKWERAHNSTQLVEIMALFDGASQNFTFKRRALSYLDGGYQTRGIWPDVPICTVAI